MTDRKAALEALTRIENLIGKAWVVYDDIATIRAALTAPTDAGASTFPTDMMHDALAEEAARMVQQSLPVGTRMLFHQDAAPTGWVRMERETETIADPTYPATRRSAYYDVVGGEVKIYRLSFYGLNSNGESDGTGQRLLWFGSKREAQRTLASIKRENELSDEGPHEIRTVEIPTDKRGLLQWLNANVNSDNG